MPDATMAGAPDSDGAPGRGAVRAALDERVRKGQLEPDPVQQMLADRLDALEGELTAGEAGARTGGRSGPLGWLFGRRERSPSPRGLYVHGKVGRGKSMLMDLFFEKSAVARRRRVHFHAFMGDVHERIGAHRAAVKAGRASGDDPIPPVAAAVASEARLLCFDEFTVNDIADAMILSRLFSALFDEGVTLVATSNVAPDDLYRDGLNRPLFLPFVEILKARTDIFELDAPTDYRLRSIGGDDLYLAPASAENAARFDGLWRSVLGSAREAPATIALKGRTIEIARAGPDAARFTFDELVSRPLGAADFLAIAERFETVLIEGVRAMGEDSRNEAKRFILLVDVLYDRHRRLAILAQAPADGLYRGRRGTEAFEFDRTVSRLIEMRSTDYGARWASDRPGRAGEPAAG